MSRTARFVYCLLFTCATLGLTCDWVTAGKPPTPTPEAPVKYRVLWFDPLTPIYAGPSKIFQLLRYRGYRR